MKKEKLQLKKGVKTFLIILFIYVLIFVFLLFSAKRIESLDENSFTESGHNGSITIIK